MGDKALTQSESDNTHTHICELNKVDYSAFDRQQVMFHISYQHSLEIETVAHVTYISFNKAVLWSCLYLQLKLMPQSFVCFCGSLPCLLSVLSLSTSLVATDCC